MKTKLKQTLCAGLIVLLSAPLTAHGFNIWEGTSGGGCNTAEGGCRFKDFEIVILNVLNFLFVIAIPITVGMIVWGAIQLMTSGGSTEKAKKAKHTMTLAVIGFVIVLASVLIVNTVKRILLGDAS
ncbi:MAG: pilin [bacterium]|nr:pilin [bacterium]